MRRFRSRAELRAIFAKIREARAGITGEQLDLKFGPTVGPAVPKTGEMSVAAKKALKKFEEAIRVDEMESGGLIDMVSGKVILEKTSDHPSMVQYSKEEFNAMKFASEQTSTVFTHNHPRGNSFSLDDIRMSAAMGVREARAVGSTGWTHSMKPDIKWIDSSGTARVAWPAQRDLEEEVNMVNEAVRSQFWGEINAGKRTIQEAEADHWHAVWTRVSKKLGMKYSRTRWKKEPK